MLLKVLRRENKREENKSICVDLKTWGGAISIEPTQEACVEYQQPSYGNPEFHLHPNGLGISRFSLYNPFSNLANEITN